MTNLDASLMAAHPSKCDHNSGVSSSNEAVCYVRFGTLRSSKSSEESHMGSQPIGYEETPSEFPAESMLFAQSRVQNDKLFISYADGRSGGERQ
jgi:hypothetical protein